MLSLLEGGGGASCAHLQRIVDRGNRGGRVSYRALRARRPWEGSRAEPAQSGVGAGHHLSRGPHF
jgi:hypothetical protein